MGLSLGIHIGHHSSCAIVKNGELVGAIQLERLSRQKHHAVAALWNQLPIQAVLDSINATIADVDMIVSCFQGGSVAGFGLHRPLIEPSFTLFDPFSDKHVTISHHLAHAHCAAAYAPREDLAVLVVDLGGSSTYDGLDYEMRFRDWYPTLINARNLPTMQVENFSIYQTNPSGRFDLKHREYLTWHNQPESAICGLASLYENVTASVFRKNNAHGSLMALAAFGENTGTRLELGAMVDINEEEVVFRNDWQHAVYGKAILLADNGDYRLARADAALLACRCQSATEETLLAYAKRAARLSGARHIAMAGGTFLNILGNSRIAESGLFESVSLPSAPHDAGIAIGCAFRGATILGDQTKRVTRDRLGPTYPLDRRKAAIFSASKFVTSRPVTPREVALRLYEGAIIARCAGRSEFGPRALGGRSLLASPLLVSSKDRLNVIKEREEWRPVAPVVAVEHLEYALKGPSHSPWMTFSHEILPEHKGQLLALAHPDGSTRAQTLFREQDPWLDDVLYAFAELTGYHILVNTSLNGPGEPIIETPEQALQWFLEHDDVDVLLLEDQFIERRDAFTVLGKTRLIPNRGAFVMAGLEDAFDVTSVHKSVVIKLGDSMLKILSPALQEIFITRQATTLSDLFKTDPELDLSDVWHLVVRNLLVECET